MSGRIRIRRWFAFRSSGHGHYREPRRTGLRAIPPLGPATAGPTAAGAQQATNGARAILRNVSAGGKALIIVAALLLLLVAGGASCHAGITQAVLDDVAVERRPDAALPLGLRFLDESAQPRTLSDVLAGKPAILVFADYSCRTLCGTVLTFVEAGLERSGLAAENQD